MKESGPERSKAVARDALGWLRRHPAAVILIIFLFHASANALVTYLDKTPLAADEAWQFEKSWYHLEAIGRADIGGFLASLGGPYPPLNRVVSLPFYLAFRYSPDIALLSTLPALLVLLISVYHIGKELHSIDAGLLAAALTPTLPGIFGFFRTYFPEPALIAAVTLSLALLLKTRHFSHRGYTLAFGMSLSLGLLAKWSFSIFVIGPFILYVGQSYLDILRTTKRPLTECLHRGSWLGLSVAVALLLSAAWYLPNLGDVFQIARYAVFEHRGFEYYGRPEVFRAGNLSFYIRALYAYQLKPLIFIVSLAALAQLIITRQRGCLFLASCPLASSLILTFIVRNKSPKFSLPYLPVFGLFIAMGLATAPRRQRRALVALVLLAATLQFLMTSYSSETLDIYQRQIVGAPHPDQRDWRLPEIVATLNSVLEGRQGSTLTVMNMDPYSPYTLHYLQLEGRLRPSAVRSIEPCLYGKDRCRNKYEYLGLLAESDIVLAERDIRSFAATTLPVQDDPQFSGAWDDLASGFEFIKSFSLTEGRPLQVYVRPPPPRIRLGETPLDESRGVVEAYYDTNAPGNVVRIGASADLTVQLPEDAEPSMLLLRYAAARPPEAEPARFIVSVNGATVAEIAEEPPHPWKVLGLPLPKGVAHNGTLHVRIESNTYVDNGKDFGITLDWVGVLCEQGSGCVGEQ